MTDDLEENVGFVIGRGTYFSQFWFLSKRGVPMDIFAALFRRDTGWLLRLRVRYYAPPDEDQDPWTGEDRKQWADYNICGDDEAPALKNARLVMQAVAAHFMLDTHELPVRTADGRTIMDALARENFAHVKVVQPE